MQDALQQEIEQYLEENWEGILGDVEALVRIASIEALDEAKPGAPYGPGPREALSCALRIAQRMGFAICDCEGYVGYAELPGTSGKQLGIIGHVDVVPAGPGWTVDPFAVTRKDGYLLGRGVVDDKGPTVVALHAVKFWADRLANETVEPAIAGADSSARAASDSGKAGARVTGATDLEDAGATGSASTLVLGASETALRHTIRVLFGANEETNMKDVDYYRVHHADPDFLFTPDAEFPVCYGEAGICSGTLASSPIANGVLTMLEGGVAVNAVPGEARATVRLAAEGDAESGDAAEAWLAGRADGAGEGADGLESDSNALGSVSARVEDGLLHLRARGKSAHASTPEAGVNAIDVMAKYLLESELLSENERRFLQLARRVTSCSDGSGLGVQASDKHFGALTAVGGTVRLEDGCVRLSIDFRYPTTTTAATIEQRVRKVAAAYGASFTMEHDKEPFLMDPDSPAVQAMLAAYNETTGENARPFTMKGGTYARVFSTGVSFGPEKPWEEKPAWVGGMHGPDEGVSEDLLKQAFAIYVRTIDKLMCTQL